MTRSESRGLWARGLLNFGYTMEDAADLIGVSARQLFRDREAADRWLKEDLSTANGER